MPTSQRRLEPLDTPAAPVIAAGTVLFAIALLVVWLTGGPSTWAWICGWGIVLGLVGVPVSRRMQRR